MQRNTSIEESELDAFEKGYRLNFEFGERLTRYRESIKTERASYNMTGQMSKHWQKYEDELQANSRNQDAFLAGKKARLKDKHDVFLLEQRKQEYVEKKIKTEKQNKSKKVDELLKIIFGSQSDIYEMKKKIKERAKWGTYLGAIFAGLIGTAVYTIGAHQQGALAGLEVPFYSFATILSTGVAAVVVEKIKDVLNEDEIEKRRDVDEERRKQELQSKERVAETSRQQLVSTVKVQATTTKDPIIEEGERRFERFMEKKESQGEKLTAREMLEHRTAFIAEEQAKAKYAYLKEPIISEQVSIREKIKNGKITESQAASKIKELNGRLEEINALEHKEYLTRLKSLRQNLMNGGTIQPNGGTTQANGETTQSNSGTTQSDDDGAR